MALKGEARDREIKRLIEEEGLTNQAISDRLGIHISTVSRRRKEMGMMGVKTSEVERWIEKHPEVRRAFGSLSPDARRNYATYFRKYSEWTEKEPKELWEEPWETIRDRIVDFRLKMEDDGKAPNTVHIYTTVIRRFYEFNNIVFKGKFFTNGTAPRAKEINEKELITPAKLKEILDVSTPMERTMYLIQFQSGLSAHELCNLRIKDVADIEENGDVKLRIEDDVIKLKLRRQKTDVLFTTFIGYDGIGELKRWIKLRQDGKVLQDREISEGAKIQKKNDFVFVTYSKRFKTWQWVRPIIYAKYMRIRVRQLGWITDDNMRENGQLNAFRPHALRMSFSEICKHKAGLNWDFVEHMLGHRMSSTDSAYVKFNDEDLLKAYKQAEPLLSLTPIEPIITDDQYTELKMKNELLEREIEEIKRKEAERAPYDEKMTEVLERLISNPEIKELIKKELKEISYRKSEKRKSLIAMKSKE